MSHHEVKTDGVCAKTISFNLEDGKLSDIHFAGGCPGNLSAISKILEGEDAERVVKILKGNVCGNRNTSCADQLAKGVEAAMQQS